MLRPGGRARRRRIQRFTTAAGDHEVGLAGGELGDDARDHPCPMLVDAAFRGAVKRLTAP
jgi:hypothetical protein